jgi:hypothetical protein
MGCDEEAVRILLAAGAVAEGHSTFSSEREVIDQGADIRTPSETRREGAEEAGAQVR